MAKAQSKLTPQEEAAILFDLYHSGDETTAYEVGCRLDNYIDPSNTVYNEREIFTLAYLAARRKYEDKEVTDLLRRLKRGETPDEIGKALKKEDRY